MADNHSLLDTLLADNHNFFGGDDTAEKADNMSNTFIICYGTKISDNNGAWQGENPLNMSLPIFFLQLTFLVGCTRLLLLVLKPLRQPRFISEILAGMLMGPSLLGKINLFSKFLLPFRSLRVLETIANLGLVYFMFLIGLEMDLTTVFRTGKKALTIALAGICLPLGLGAGLLYFLQNGKMGFSFMSSVFWGVALTVTSFPVLTLILADLKLLHTDVGKTALSSAIVSDMFSWVLLAVALGITNNEENFKMALLFTAAFIILCIYVVRPGIKWIICRLPEGETFNDFHLCVALTGVVLCGLVTDLCGMHSITGAFVFGLIIPNGEIGVRVAEKLEDAVTWLLLPLFFIITGIRVNFEILIHKDWAMVVGVIAVACVAKIISTLLVAFFYDIRFREGMALGLLMNTKGILALVILHVGRDQKVFNDQAYTTVLLAILIMTALVTPIMQMVYRPSKRYMQHKRRSMQTVKSEMELRILACIHESRNVQGIINLLEASNPTRRTPICIFALHLVELTGRASAMLILHTTRKSGAHNPSRAQAEWDNIITAFEKFEQESSGVSVQPLTALSPYATIDEDICNLAEDKRVALVILPFHKQLTIDGKLKDTNPAFRGINQNVLARALCSVGIFVDRGLGASPCRIAVVYVVGRDDREALSCAWRMAGHPGVSLDVVRFLPGEDAMDAVEPMDLPGDNDGILSVITDYEKEKSLDDTYINEFRLKTVNDGSIMYSEKVANSGEETVGMIRAMHHNYDLFVVGRGQGVISPLTAGLSDWTDNPELGAIGDLLVSSEFDTSASVLVVQQYAGAGHAGDGVGTPIGSPRQTEQFNIFDHMNWRPPLAGGRRWS